jgi:hypothetical protein
MTSISRCGLAVALLALACGQKSGGSKIAGLTGDGGPTPGEETGPSGTRGGGGAFGAGSDPDGAAPDAAVAGDTPAAGVDAAPDLPHDRPRDVTLTPTDGVVLVVDSAPAADASADPCGPGGTCEMLESEYVAALARARICNTSLKMQCQMTTGTGLRCPGCKVWVNSTVELDALRAKWNAASCQTCSKMPCPQYACRALTTGICHSSMLAAQDPMDPGRILPPPMLKGSCIDQSDPVPF